MATSYQDAYSNALAQLGGMGSGLLQNYVNAGNYVTTANTSASTFYIQGVYNKEPSIYTPAVPIETPIDQEPDEFKWLRRRVADTCWKKAA